MARPSAESVEYSGPFREAITHIQEGRWDEGVRAFCRAAQIQMNDRPASAGNVEPPECERLCELLYDSDRDSVTWWGDIASAWWNAGINAVARGCLEQARKRAVSGGGVTWDDLRRLAAIDLSKQPGVVIRHDPLSGPAVRAAEDPRLKLNRLWTHFDREGDTESPDVEKILDSDPVAAILVFRSMNNLALSRWIPFWNQHGQPGIAIDNFFAATSGNRFDEFLFSGDYNFWALFYLAESFQDSSDPISAYAALLLLSMALTAGVAPQLTSQQREERLGQTRENLKNLDWVAPDFQLYAMRGSNFATGCQMADWFVANGIPGRFLEFLGDEVTATLAARSPLFKQRLDAMVRNGGWVREFIPDLDETLSDFPSLSEFAAPFPPSLPALVPEQPTAKRRAMTNLFAAKRQPRPDVTQVDLDGSIELTIGLQNNVSVRALHVHFGHYNPLAIIHRRARQVLPQLILQLIAQGKSVVWIRDAKQDASPAGLGVKAWSWTRRSSNEQANLLTTLTWSEVLHETIVNLLSSSAHISFRNEIRQCLNGLLSWVAGNPSMLKADAKRSRFLQSMEQIYATGLELDGTSGLRRLAVLGDSLMNFLEDLCRAVTCETTHHGEAGQPSKLAVFDTEGESQLNSVSLLLFVGSLIGVLRNRYELDFDINPRLRRSPPDSGQAESSTASLEEQRARFKEMMARKLEERTQSEPPSIIDGRVADICIVASGSTMGTITSLLNWLSPGYMGAGACLLLALEQFPETPDFLSEFKTFVLGPLSEAERFNLRVSSSVSLPSHVDDSEAAVATVSPQFGGLTISSGLLWPRDDRRI